MDVIPWVIGLVAGITMPFRFAAAMGVAASLAVRAYQYFLAEPRVWGKDFPEDLYGATAMVALTVLLAWVGSIVRARRERSSEVTA